MVCYLPHTCVCLCGGEIEALCTSKRVVRLADVMCGARVWSTDSAMFQLCFFCAWCRCRSRQGKVGSWWRQAPFGPKFFVVRIFLAAVTPLRGVDKISLGTPYKNLRSAPVVSVGSGCGVGAVRMGESKQVGIEGGGGGGGGIARVDSGLGLPNVLLPDCANVNISRLYDWVGVGVGVGVSESKI